MFSLQNMHFYLYLHSANAMCLFNAKVAQLVEHDLAKVGVASSNLVFRSNPFQKKGFIVKKLLVCKKPLTLGRGPNRFDPALGTNGEDSIPALSTNHQLG